MKYERKISEHLKQIIKNCTTIDERKKVAKRHHISFHTLNSVVDGNRNISFANQDAITELVARSIQNASAMHMSLLDYFDQIKQIKFI
jgi:hypothetical protein